MGITQTITEIPAPPLKGVDLPAEFDEKASLFLGALPTLQNELNIYAAQLNSTATNVDAKETSATTAATTAASAAATAVSAATTATGAESVVTTAKTDAQTAATIAVNAATTAVNAKNGAEYAATTVGAPVSALWTAPRHIEGEQYSRILKITGDTRMVDIEVTRPYPWNDNLYTHRIFLYVPNNDFSKAVITNTWGGVGPAFVAGSSNQFVFRSNNEAERSTELFLNAYYWSGYRFRVLKYEGALDVSEFTRTGYESDLLGIPALVPFVNLTDNQTIGGVKTFSDEPVLPSKSSAAGDNPTKPATEAQVYAALPISGSFTKPNGQNGTFTIDAAGVYPLITLVKTASKVEVRGSQGVYCEWRKSGSVTVNRVIPTNQSPLIFELALDQIASLTIESLSGVFDGAHGYEFRAWFSFNGTLNVKYRVTRFY
ncbi:MAG: hypothetical protein LBO72_08080 [Helicobacteraceae bacterium]|jgi:hypothetical protein|nr:hypothetical protein [Helicobacteraceae bacterium]